MNADAPRSAHPRPLASEGFVIVSALWILAALATLAAIYSVYVVRTATVMGVNGERIEVEALVTAALDLAVLKMTSTKIADPPWGRFSFRLGGANIAVDFRSEAGRIDLNTASKELLAGLFTT